MIRSRSYLAELAALSFAGLLLEIGATRLLSFKLFHPFAFLALGVALLGVAAGAAVVALAGAWPRRSLDRLLAAICLAGSLAVGAGHVVVARLRLDTSQLGSGVAEPAKLAVLGLALASGFAALGLASALLFARRPAPLHRLYAAELAGAALGALAAAALVGRLGAPASLQLAGAVLALAGLAATRGGPARGLRAALAAAALALAAPLALPDLLPDTVPDRFAKHVGTREPSEFTRWGPVFRVDVARVPDADDRFRAVFQDGLWSATLVRFDGEAGSREHFERDPRSLPFAALGAPPAQVAVLGAAGGHEVLAALRFGARRVSAVELDAVTLSLLASEYADYTGNLHRNPRVELVHAEARAWLARAPQGRFDLVWLVAPETYAATNAGSLGAQVLPESPLFTVEAIETGLARLSERGVLAAHFGEWSYEDRPLRTARYLATAREAFRRLGVERFADHALVATTPGFFQLATVLLKRTPFGPEEVARFLEQTRRVPGSRVRHAGGLAFDDGAANEVLALADAPLARFLAAHPHALDPATDDRPYFWHFVRFRDAFAALAQPYAPRDVEDGIAERLLLGLLAAALAGSLAVLLVPAALARRAGRAIPRAGRTAAGFAALGIGLLCYEVPLVQKLALLLGHPAYALPATLAALLGAAGLGALASGRATARPGRGLGVRLAALAALTLFYASGLDRLVAALLPAPFLLRAAFAVACLAPLGAVLGGFLPLGLAALAAAAPGSREAPAFALAASGVAAVVGCALATIVAMGAGFDAVLACGLAAYAVAAAALRGLAPARAAAASP
jgi:hypothetical protein